MRGSARTPHTDTPGGARLQLGRGGPSAQARSHSRPPQPPPNGLTRGGKKGPCRSFEALISPPKKDAAATYVFFVKLQVPATLPHGGHLHIIQLLGL